MLGPWEGLREPSSDLPRHRLSISRLCCQPLTTNILNKNAAQFETLGTLAKRTGTNYTQSLCRTFEKTARLQGCVHAKTGLTNSWPRGRCDSVTWDLRWDKKIAYHCKSLGNSQEDEQSELPLGSWRASALSKTSSGGRCRSTRPFSSFTSKLAKLRPALLMPFPVSKL